MRMLLFARLSDSCLFFFFKQKTAYEMRISDWSSDVCSSDLQGDIPLDNEMPDVRKLRIPLKYLANLLTAGDEQPVALGLERMLAMRAYMRRKHVDGVLDATIVERVGLTDRQVEEMYRYMAIAGQRERLGI